jgi:hypothetical protein
MVYRSALRQDGPVEVAVNLGNERDAATFELALAAPTVTLDAPATLRRVGSAVDTPLALLQPAVMRLAAVVSWADGQPRALTDIVFTVDGVPQPQAAPPTPDAGGRIELVWDVSERDAGSYELAVEVADELGFRASSAPAAVTIETARPSPPTPTAVPTPDPAAQADGGAMSLALPLGLLALAGGALFWGVRRARRRPEATAPAAAPPPPPPPREGQVAVLEWAAEAEDAPAEAIELLGDNVTLGSEPDAVDIVLAGPDVSRLHARIRRDGEGRYWLYDEGSSAGTFLNYEQLGLAPRPLQHGDVIQLGRVALRFRLVEVARGD